MNRILVVLPNWFGETLFATPFLRLLRTLRPNAFLATLGWPQCRDILLHNSRVDELLDYDEPRLRWRPWTLWPLLATLRARRFDAAFILRRSLSRTALLALAGIPERIGFDNAKRGWLLTRRIPVAPEPRHKASAYLPLLEAVGGSSSLDGPYEYVVTEEERRSAQALLHEQGIGDNRPFVILHPGANWPHKRWAPERFAQLGDRLVAMHHVQVVMTGQAGDVALAESIRQMMREPVTMLVGRTTLRQLGGCLEQAQLVISNDTGVLHLAAALSRPVVALYGPTSPALTGPLGHPTRTIVLRHPGCCPRIPC
jgi:lipopolysaccharide heptosyltransferase II